MVIFPVFSMSPVTASLATWMDPGGPWHQRCLNGVIRAPFGRIWHQLMQSLRSTWPGIAWQDPKVRFRVAGPLRT